MFRPNLNFDSIDSFISKEIKEPWVSTQRYLNTIILKIWTTVSVKNILVPSRDISFVNKSRSRSLSANFADSFNETFPRYFWISAICMQRSFSMLPYYDPDWQVVAFTPLFVHHSFLTFSRTCTMIGHTNLTVFACKPSVWTLPRNNVKREYIHCASAMIESKEIIENPRNTWLSRVSQYFYRVLPFATQPTQPA